MENKKIRMTPSPLFPLDEELEVINLPLEIVTERDHILAGSTESTNVQTLVKVPSSTSTGGIVRILILCDVSPSMGSCRRIGELYGFMPTTPLELLHAAIKHLATDLLVEDSVAIHIAFGRFSASANVVTNFCELCKETAATFLDAAAMLMVNDKNEGSTNHQAAIECGIEALEDADKMTKADANHLIIFTDGDATSGERNPLRLKTHVANLAQASSVPVITSTLVLGSNVNLRIAEALYAPTHGVVAHARVATALREELGRILGLVGKSALPFVLNVNDGVDLTSRRRVYCGMVTDVHRAHAVELRVAPCVAKSEPVAAAFVGLASSTEQTPVKFAFMVDVPATTMPQELADALEIQTYAFLSEPFHFLKIPLPFLEPNSQSNAMWKLTQVESF